jgi:hypothetical protein
MSRKPAFSRRVALLPVLLIGAALLPVEHTTTLRAATRLRVNSPGQTGGFVAS